MKRSAKIRAEIAEADARRAEAEAERARIDAIWGPLDLRSVQRAAMLAAAFVLGEHAKDFALAGWLLRARPEHAREIATGVAVHALMSAGIAGATVRDIFAATDTFDLAQADEWFDANEAFEWQPDPSHLIGDEH